VFFISIKSGRGQISAIDCHRFRARGHLQKVRKVLSHFNPQMIHVSVNSNFLLSFFSSGKGISRYFLGKYAYLRRGRAPPKCLPNGPPAIRCPAYGAFSTPVQLVHAKPIRSLHREYVIWPTPKHHPQIDTSMKQGSRIEELNTHGYEYVASNGINWRSSLECRTLFIYVGYCFFSSLDNM
jgi:hypothetical protein